MLTTNRNLYGRVAAAALTTAAAITIKETPASGEVSSAALEELAPVLYKEPSNSLGCLLALLYDALSKNGQTL